MLQEHRGNVYFDRIKYRTFTLIYNDIGSFNYPFIKILFGIDTISLACKSKTTKLFFNSVRKHYQLTVHVTHYFEKIHYIYLQGPF